MILFFATALMLSSGAIWPTKGWPASTPAAEGLDAAVLDRLDAELASGKHGYVDGLLVIRNGRVVYEKTYRNDYAKLFQTAPDRVPGPYNYYDPAWYPYEHGSDLHTMQSVSKSVTSALVGIAIRRGEIPGVDAKAAAVLLGLSRRGGSAARAHDAEGPADDDLGHPLGRDHGRLHGSGQQLRADGGQQGLDPVRSRPAHGRRAGLDVRLFERRDGAPRRGPPKGDRKTGRRLRRRASLRAARDLALLLEEDADGSSRHGGRPVPDRARSGEDRVPVHEGRRLGRTANSAGGLGRRPPRGARAIRPAKTPR